MAFVKLDCKILDSTIWLDRQARELFLTALLMARPHVLASETPQINVDSLEPTGFVIPPGEYGFIPAAGPGIINRAGMDVETGVEALKRLGSPEPASSSTRFEGRRLVRIDGGYIVLNYILYRDKDHTAALRAKRYRAKKKSKRAPRWCGPDSAKLKIHTDKTTEQDEQSIVDRT